VFSSLDVWKYDPVCAVYNAVQSAVFNCWLLQA
jgi:hypothetical protein